jgi:putative nucleotidyltransferase with HDIG domain
LIESYHPPGMPCRGQLLVVDHEPDAVRAIAHIVNGLGYEAVCTTETSQALTLLSLRRFDAVVSGLRLPMPSGGVFAAHVAILAPEVPLIVVTGAGDLQEVSDLLSGSKVEAVIPKSDLNGALAKVLARSVSTGRGARETEQAARLVADGLVRALALRDVETEAHSRRVSAWTLMLAQRLGVPKEDWLRAELGGLLHDIGKIGVPDSILRKPDKLTEEEWVEMRRHPVLGCTILSGIPSLDGASDIVRSHHERWDGAGYPDKFAGEDIPWHARIFALVDTYDAVTCDRPYRKGRSHSAATDVIRAEAARQFDPRVVEALLDVPEPEWLSVARIFVDHGGAAAR